MERTKTASLRSSSYQWSREASLQSSRTSCQDLSEREGERSPSPSAAVLALRDLLSDLKCLDRKVEKLERLPRIDVKQQQAELVEPIDSLEAAMTKLSVKTRERFNLLEASLDATEEDCTALAENVCLTANRTRLEVVTISQARQSTRTKTEAPLSQRDSSQEAERHAGDADRSRCSQTPVSYDSSCVYMGTVNKSGETARPPRSFPLLSRPLPPRWESRLNDPRFYYELVDVLISLSTPSGEIDSEDVHAAVRSAMGKKLYYEVLDATGGTMRFFGMAERFIKLRWLRFNVVSLTDLTSPFWENKDNKAYFARGKDLATARARGER